MGSIHPPGFLMNLAFFLVGPLSPSGISGSLRKDIFI